ncbi:glycosyltransferase [Acetonema longum]|uniref:Glycosyltransferase 2-like domain-containing protein n=1 Tax=Acetonema longum DSM 6540 TaxID=1009370 RepID=F7NNT3_9FIRM|nr:hypothetical protein [Acetonema longum]EGO62267.1 hypothetical protein ALO_18872 [Acetonema longum DSM 6540]
MFFPYAVSVMLLSLAIYGFWHLILECWVWYIKPRMSKLPSVSLLLVVKNHEQDIEFMLRHIIRKIECCAIHPDLVVVENGSTDLTPHILGRFVGEYHALRVLYLPTEERTVAAALPLCRGGAVYVFDMVNRLTPEECLAALDDIFC